MILSGLLVGCAATTPQPDELPMTPEPARVVADEARVSSPGAGLTGELLYQLLAGEIAGQRRMMPVATEFYLAAARNAVDPRVAERAARLALFAGNEPAAREASKLWVKLAPADHQGRQIMAALHIRAGEVDAATEQLEALIELVGAESGESFMAIGGLLSREEDQETALAVMDNLVAEHQDNPEALFAQAHMAMRLGKHDRAGGALQRVLALRPDWTRALVLRASLQREQGGPEAALDDLESAVDGNPDDRTLRLTYAQYLVDADELEQARREFNHLAEERPEDAEVRFALGLLNLEMGEPEKAERHMRFLVENNEAGNDNAVFFLGQAMMAQGQEREAERWFRRVEDGEYRFNARLLIARIMAERGEIVEARHFLQSVEPESEDEQVRLILTEGRLLREAGHLESAFEVYSRGLQRHPRQRDLLYERALVAERLDRIDVLEDDLRQLLEREPEHTHALNALGYTLVDRTDRIEEGMEYIRQAHENQPNDPAILDSMGWGYYRLGKLKKAEEYLRRAMEKAGDAEIAAHLGEILWERDKRDEARAVWEKGLEADPDDQFLRETMRRLLP
ncbi:MAG: tetratricopeptide repeat protein [Pseudomonadota bacterium]